MQTLLIRIKKLGFAIFAFPRVVMLLFQLQQRTPNGIVNLLIQLKKAFYSNPKLEFAERLLLPSNLITIFTQLQQLVPDKLERLLSHIDKGLENNISEENRYQIAESLTAIVYPKYKFSGFARLYLEDKDFLNYYQRHMDSANWSSLDRKYTLDQLLKLIGHLNGDIAECGTYKGFSAYRMCLAAQGKGRLIHLFDSFQGYPKPKLCDGNYHTEGDSQTLEEALHKTLHEFTNYRVYKGWIPERFPDIANLLFSFLHIDVELYQPTLDSLQFFYERMVIGGLILFDDYGFKTCPGVKQAVDEFFADKAENIIILATGQAFIIKCSSTNKREVELYTPPQRMTWTPELVQCFWNGFSQTRLIEYSFSKYGGKSLIVAIDHLLPRNGKILDFGAGDGDLIKPLCEKGLQVAAFEPSESRAQFLTQQLKNYSGFLGVVGMDTTETFDVVMMIEVIEHILQQQLNESLERIKRLTHMGGILIITTPNNEDLELGMAYCPVSNTLFHRWQHVRSFTDRSLVELLSSHGFEEIVTHLVEFKDALFMKFDNFSASTNETVLPSYMTELRANRPTRIGGETNILYIGRRIS